ncbi:MAG: threonine ammonia-lyase, biosynthetic [Pseudomonadota bacterium]
MIHASDYLKRILTARVYDVAERTPLEPASELSTRLGNRVWLKREDLQPVFSFKLRGAYNRIVNLAPEERTHGVICSSAGNHAQGVALAAQRLKLRAVIVMPLTTPRIKIEAVRRLGGEIVLHGETYDDAYAHARLLAERDGLTFIHPFDDPDVIAGQGTIAMEVLGQHPGKIDAIFVPIGGGGLAAGIATYVKALAPDTRVIGVEPRDAASMQAALAAGAPVTLEHVGIFADGVAVRRVGDETFRLCQAHVDEVVTVDTDQICAAIRDIFEATRSVVEPAGALAVAGLKRVVERDRLRERELVAVNCGANMNFDRLRHIAERASIGEQQEMLVAVEIPEQRGSFLDFCRAIGTRNVTEFSYRYADPQHARIFVGLELSEGAAERERVLTGLRERGYQVQDLSDDELTKVHIRHMIGGAGERPAHECLYRFEFPEKPGALMRFLQVVGGEWNISLFHYRNHGSDHGRVLTALQVPSAERDRFHAHLDDLGFPRWDESDNPAYRQFLARDAATDQQS